MKVYKGGCAIMAKIDQKDAELLNERTIACLENELVDPSDPAKPPSCDIVDVADYHVTVRFVGRDLPAATSLLVISSAFAAAVRRAEKPVEIRFTGKVQVNKTGKGSYLVALVEPTEELLGFRELIDKELAEMGVVPKDSFKFVPHVTLAEKVTKPILTPFEPFVAKASILEVKYGRHRMNVEI